MTDQTDIVERLRAFIRDDYEPPRPKTALLMQEAAAEITRLRDEAEALRNALIGLEEAYCRASPQMTREERHEDRLRLIAARDAIAATTKEQKNDH